MGRRKCVANRLGNEQKLDIRQLKCDEYTLQYKITSNRKTLISKSSTQGQKDI